MKRAITVLDNPFDGLPMETLWSEEPSRPNQPLFQLVFCDLGTPREGDLQVYGKVREALIAGGMDPQRIRFIHEAKTDAGKGVLFADCRAGKVDVLLGSTEKLGTGTNIQTYLGHLHHLDAPWRPADVEQREGRALRPGNLYNEVRVTRYVTQGSFDAYMWQALERKMRFISQVLTGGSEAREVEDIGDAALSYAEVKALATGNPLVLELAEADAEITRLRRLQSGHVRDMRRLELDIEDREERAQKADYRAGRMEKLEAARKETEPALFPLGVTTTAEALTDRTEIGAALGRSIAEAMVDRGQEIHAARYRGQMVKAKALLIYQQWQLDLLIGTSGYGDYEEVQVHGQWVAKGQEWRFAAALEGLFENAAAHVDGLRSRAALLRQEAAAARKQGERPFEHAEAVKAAEARKAAVEARIEAAVDKDKDRKEEESAA